MKVHLTVKSRIFILVLASLIIGSMDAYAQPTKKGLFLNPRFDYWPGSSDALSQRVRTYGRAYLFYPGFGFYGTGFVERDFASSAKDRGLDSRIDYQEGYFEVQLQQFFMRIGRQKIRWSERWLRPNLDFWTAHDTASGLVDPLEERLIHSTGTLFGFKPSPTATKVK